MKQSEKIFETTELEEEEENFDSDDDKTCPFCKAQDKQILSQNKLFCSACGYIYPEDQEIDFSPEWRNFSNDKSKKSRGVNKVSETSFSSRTVVLDSKDSLKFKKWQQKLLPIPLKERNQKTINENIELISQEVFLKPAVIKETKELIESVLNTTLIRGRSIKTITAAATCIVLRKNEVPKTIKEVSIKLGIPKKELGRAVKFIKSKMKIKTDPVNPTLFLKRFVSAFKVDPSVEHELNWYAEKLSQLTETIGKGPVSIAGAIFFFFLKKYNHKITQAAFLDKTTITEVTLKFINMQIKEKLIKFSEEYDKLKKENSF